MEEKKRHGCVSAWLVLMILVNSMSALVYFILQKVMPEVFQGILPEKNIIILGVLATANVVFAVFLLQWKKIGFWGYAGTTVIVFIINLQSGLGMNSSVFGLAGIAILYGILQIKQDGVTAWENLE